MTSTVASSIPFDGNDRVSSRTAPLTYVVFLGSTTNRYATVDLEMKRKAIEQARPIDHSTATLALWRTDASILRWLETL